MIRKFLKNTLLVILIIILLYVCYAKYIRKDPVVKIGGYGILIVLTNSMEPIIKEKELIMIKESSDYKLNDIVTYCDLYGTLITHRIVQINEDDFMARGDNNSVIDENMNLSQIQGKVIYHSKILGIFILYYLKFIIVICILIYVIIYLKRKFEKEQKEEKDETKEE